MEPSWGLQLKMRPAFQKLKPNAETQKTMHKLKIPLQKQTKQYRRFFPAQEDDIIGPEASPPGALPGAPGNLVPWDPPLQGPRALWL